MLKEKQDNSLKRKVTLSDFIKVPFAILIVFFIIFAIYDSGQEEQKQAPAKTNTIEQATVVPEVTPEVDVSQYNYQVVKREDYSIPSAKRLEIRVLVSDESVSETEIKAISQKIVEENKGDFDALSILYYKDSSKVESAYDLAKADWAPNGNWGDADLKTNQILVYSFKDIVVK